MRADAVGLRTWLLAVIAGWALLAWVLALAGMGGRIEPLPADPVLTTALPAAATKRPPKLRALAEYDQATARPLFFSDRRPKAFSLKPGGDAATQDSFDYVLSSVLITPRLRMAIVQPPDGGESIRFKLGEDSDKMPGWHLTELSPRRATFASATETRELELRVFDGRSGEPPTVLPSLQSRVPPAAQVPMPAPAPTRKQETASNLKPAQPQPQVPPAAAPALSPPPPVADAAAEPTTNEAQVQAIRQRIEARRAKLRQEAQPVDQPRN